MISNRFAQIAVLGLVAVGLVNPISASASPLVGEARFAATSNSSTVANYIVIFKDSANLATETSKLNAAGIAVGRRYENIFKGLTAEMNSAQLNALSKNPQVRLIEADQVVSIDATQNTATWGIDRIDQTTGLSTTYDYTSTGSGVKAYVIDTGILASHSEFEGRVISGYTAITDGRGTTDCNGHGTHVAGTIGGKTYGVAKSVTLVPVRVLNCQGSGTNSGVIAGMDWVVANATAPNKSVVNMSLGGGASQAVDDAVNRLVTKGVTTVVAAGNSTADACTASPARASAAITVAASDRTDTLATFSNFGNCVDIIAPGVSITSAWPSSTTATNTISGTSMASPHVAGAVALILQPGAGKTPSEVDSQLRTQGTPNVIGGNLNGTPNIFLFTNPNGITVTSTPEPGAVSGLRLSAQSTNGMTVSWIAPTYTGTSSVIDYQVERSLSADFASPTKTTVASGTTLVISGLTDGTNYFIRVAARNTSGNGPWITISGPTVSAPPVFGATSSTKTSVSLTWNSPSPTVTRYIIEMSTNGGAYRTISSTWTSTSVNVTNLKSLTNYTFRVSAVNAAGTSSPSNSVTVRTK
ncbi:MAG: S8 family serine peptidase [Actinomycetota bacterium]